MATENQTNEEKGKVLFDTQAYLQYADDQEVYDAFLEELEMNDKDISEYPETIPNMGEPHFDEFFQWCVEYAQRDYEDFTANMEESQYNNKCVLYGVIGRWNGNFAIDYYAFDTITEAIDKCLDGGINDIDAHLFGDRIEVNAHHHDGTNRFVIKLLSPKGVEALDDYKDGTYDPETEEWNNPDFEPEGDNVLPMPEYLF